MDKYMERVGANYWTGLARREYKTILKKDLKPRAVTMVSCPMPTIPPRSVSPALPVHVRVNTSPIIAGQLRRKCIRRARAYALAALEPSSQPKSCMGNK